MTDHNIADLDISLQTLAQKFLDQVNAAIFPNHCHITITWRDSDAQNKAKSCGLSNAAAGQSPHNCALSDGTPASRAFDFAILDSGLVYIKDGTNNLYFKAGEIAESLGLSWGGRWHHPDYDHVEMTDWKIDAIV